MTFFYKTLRYCYYILLYIVVITAITSCTSNTSKVFYRDDKFIEEVLLNGKPVGMVELISYSRIHDQKYTLESGSPGYAGSLGASLVAALITGLIQSNRNKTIKENRKKILKPPCTTRKDCQLYIRKMIYQVVNFEIQKTGSVIIYSKDSYSNRKDQLFKRLLRIDHASVPILSSPDSEFIKDFLSSHKLEAGIQAVFLYSINESKATPKLRLETYWRVFDHKGNTKARYYIQLFGIEKQLNLVTLDDLLDLAIKSTEDLVLIIQNKNPIHSKLASLHE